MLATNGLLFRVRFLRRRSFCHCPRVEIITSAAAAASGGAQREQAIAFSRLASRRFHAHLSPSQRPTDGYDASFAGLSQCLCAPLCWFPMRARLRFRRRCRRVQVDDDDADDATAITIALVMFTYALRSLSRPKRRALRRMRLALNKANNNNNNNEPPLKANILRNVSQTPPVLSRARAKGRRKRRSQVRASHLLRGCSLQQHYKLVSSFGDLRERLRVCCGDFVARLRSRLQCCARAARALGRKVRARRVRKVRRSSRFRRRR